MFLSYCSQERPSTSIVMWLPLINCSLALLLRSQQQKNLRSPPSFCSETLANFNVQGPLTLPPPTPPMLDESLMAKILVTHSPQSYNYINLSTLSFTKGTFVDAWHTSLKLLIIYTLRHSTRRLWEITQVNLRVRTSFSIFIRVIPSNLNHSYPSSSPSCVFSKQNP